MIRDLPVLDFEKFSVPELRPKRAGRLTYFSQKVTGGAEINIKMVPRRKRGSRRVSGYLSPAHLRQLTNRGQLASPIERFLRCCSNSINNDRFYDL